MMKKPRLRVTDLNPCLSCILCGGYFIDATTITECLHSFCRACIVRYLETSKYCPVCDVRVHKTRPLRCIRSDKMLQDIVYKLVPGLYQNEMKGRRDLYASQPPEAILASRDEEDRGEGMENRFIYTAEEIFDLTIEYQHKKRDNDVDGLKAESASEEVPIRRYMRCPAAFRISHLKKFIRLKYSIPSKLQVAIQHQDELLEDDYSLMDVAYITSWKRAGPLQFTFDVQERPKIQPLFTFLSDVHTAAPPETSSKDKKVNPQRNTEVNSAASDGVLGHHNKGCNGSTTLRSESANLNATSSDATPAEMSVGITTKSSEVKDPHDSSVTTESSTNQKCDSVSEAKTSHLSSSSRGRVRSASGERSRKHMKHKSRRKRKSSASIKSCPVSNLNLEEFSDSPPKVPKLTISLTPKILQMAAQHAEEDKLDLSSDFYEGRLVISEPDKSPKGSDGYCSDHVDSPKIVGLDDLESEKKEEEEIIVDDDEVDSGRGSDGSSRVENEDICSPLSSTVLTPDLEKPVTFLLPSPSSLPSPSVNSIEDVSECKVSLANDISKPIDNIPPLLDLKKDDFGVLDLSTCSSKRTDDSAGPVYRSKPVANPPVLDKFRQTNPCLPLPMVSSYKLLPTVFAHSGHFKKTDYPPGSFRYNRGNSFAVVNPDPNSCRPKIVIKNLDATKPGQRHHHHHHHHHHHNHNHQRA